MPELEDRLFSPSLADDKAPQRKSEAESPHHEKSTPENKGFHRSICHWSSFIEPKRSGTGSLSTFDYLFDIELGHVQLL